MKRNTKIVIIVAAALILAAGVLALLNRGSILQKQAMQEEGTFLVSAGGQTYVVAMDDLLALSPRGVQANAKSSTTDYTKKQFTGVPLAAVLRHLDVDCSAAEKVIFTAADGFTSVISLADALDEESCFIIFEEDGKPLGTKASGGTGPFRMILTKDPYANRWCKFLLEITI